MFNLQEGDVPKVHEQSLMISGMIPLIIEVNGTPIWINSDVNSPHAFRPSSYRMEVSFFI